MRYLCHLLIGLALASLAVADDATEKPILVLDTGGHTARVAKVLFTPDGRELITVSDDKTIRVWDVASGAPLRVLRPPIGPGLAGMLYAAALSPDGRTLAVGGMTGGTHIYTRIYLISRATGRIERVLKGHTGVILNLAFAPDGRRLASGSSDKTARIWEVADGRCEQLLQGHTDRILGVYFSPDGRRLATASFDKTGRIWWVATGQTEAVLRGHDKEVNCVAWSPDGKTVATGSVDQTIRLWKPDGTAIKRLNNLKNPITSLSFSANSRKLLYTCGGKTSVNAAVILDSAEGLERVRFTQHNNTVMDGAFSPDGTLAASAGGNDNETYLWRTADAKPVHRLVGKGHTNYSAGWSRDSKAIAWGNTRRLTSRIDPPRFNDLGPLEHAFLLTKLEPAIASDDKSIRRAQPALGSISLQSSGTTTVAVKEGDATLGTFDAHERINCFTLLPGDRVAIGTEYSLYLFDARSGKRIRQFVGHTGAVWAVAPSPDGRFLLSASKDQTLRVWDPDRNKPVLSLFFAGDDWIAWTPEGYYAASPGGEQLMGWHVNNGPEAMASFYPASHFRKTLYRPDVIKRLIDAGSLIKALVDAYAAAGQRNRRTGVAQVLPPKVAITAPRTTRVQINGKTLDVEAVASSVGSNPVTELRLLLDGRPVPEGFKAFPSPALGEVRATWTVEVPPGIHRLTVQADSGVSKSLSEPVEVAAAAGPGPAKASGGTLYVLAVGINDYPDKRLKLNCAAPDAQSLRQAFLTHSRRLFPGGVEVRLLLDAQATRASMLEGLSWLAGAVKFGDVAVVFYAGHGDCKIEGQFYLVPFDADLRNLSGTGVSGEALKKAIGDLPCTTMLILDACYAGSFDGKKKGKKTRALPVHSDAVVRDLVYDSGLVVMCGASKEQEAAEENGKGFFTQAITEGMGGKADYDKDGRVEVLELQMYVAARVRELSKGDQEPTISIPSVVRAFALSKP